MRFNFVKRLVDALLFDSLAEIAAKIEPLGWHVVIYFEAGELPEQYDFWRRRTGLFKLVPGGQIWLKGHGRALR